MRSRLRHIVQTVGRRWRICVTPSIQEDNDHSVSFAGLQIRTPKANELAAVLSMVRKSCALHQNWDPSKFAVVEDFTDKYGRWLRERVNDPHSVFLVAAADGQPVAFLIGTIDHGIPIYRVSTYGYIRDLWVEESHRRTGIGREIVKMAIARFTQLGVEQVRLEVAAKNPSARPFFESCGFRISAIEMLIEQEADIHGANHSGSEPSR